MRENDEVIGIEINGTIYKSGQFVIAFFLFKTHVAEATSIWYFFVF